MQPKRDLASLLVTLGRESHVPLRFREAGICRLLFEDRHLLIVDKQAGFLTVPTEREEQKTVVGALARYLKHTQRGRSKPLVVHRLDRDTSGVLVFCKTRESADHLGNQFKEHKPGREYIAVVAGNVAQLSGRFESYLATDKALNQRSLSRNKEQGKLSVTDYEVCTHLGDTTLVSVRLETGRRNQIRVQFAESGHPVLGDQRYRPELAFHRGWPYKRLALHAATLRLTHPESNQVMEFRAPLPQEFLDFIKRCR